MAKNTAVFGIYSRRLNLDNAVDTLRGAGFRNTDISVLFAHNEGTKDFAHEKGTKAPEGAAAGAGSGAIIGGTLGWLAGIGALARNPPPAAREKEVHFDEPVPAHPDLRAGRVPGGRLCDGTG